MGKGQGKGLFDNREAREQGEQGKRGEELYLTSGLEDSPHLRVSATDISRA